MTEEITNVNPAIVKALADLKTAVQSCKDKDDEQAKTAEKKIDDKDGFCRSPEVKKFKEAATKIVDDMWAQYNALKENYESGLRTHENVATNLHKVYNDTWQQMDKAVEPILTDIENRQQQTHWKGPGAEEYMKQLPAQYAAVQEFRQYIQVAGSGVETPALLQHGVFLGFQSLLTSRKEAISGYAETDPGEHYYQRCDWARAALKQANDWVKDTMMTGKECWKPPLDDHVRQMTSTKVTSPEVLKGDKWPNAAKGDTSGLKPPTAPKYTAPGGASGLPSAPGTERGDGKGLQTSDYGA